MQKHAAISLFNRGGDPLWPIYDHKEKALHGQFASKIIESVLGYRGPTGGPEYTVATERAILRGSVDLALGRFGSKISESPGSFGLGLRLRRSRASESRANLA